MQEWTMPWGSVWVPKDEAEAEKSKYGQASFDNGFRAGAAKERESKEPRCTCGERSACFVHHTNCPCYKPPEKTSFEPPEGTWCPECGPNVKVDEEGLCVSCGATAIGDGANEALRLLKGKPPEVKPLVKLIPENQSCDDATINTINALVDAVNELRKKK